MSSGFFKPFIGETSHKIINDQGFEREIPTTGFYNAIPSLVFALVILFVGFAIDLILLLIPNPPNHALKDLTLKNRPLRESATKTLVKYVLKDFLPGLIIGSATDVVDLSGVVPGNFEIADTTLDQNAGVAVSYHPFAVRSSNLVNDVTAVGSTNQFTLGQNKLNYNYYYNQRGPYENQA